MPNTTPRSTVPSRVCPTCGTRIAETASRCAVCGMEFEPVTGRTVKAPPRISGGGNSFNLPIGVIIAGPALFIIVGALIVLLLVRLGVVTTNPTVNPTPSATPTITQTSQPTGTEAPTIMPSPLPPIEITVRPDENCLIYASRYHVPSTEIIKLNDLTADCTDLRIGQKLLIPQPTPTQPPPATATFNILEQTRTSCPLVAYEVKDGDALSTIAGTYNVPIDALKEWNPNIFGDTVFAGMTINIPLCRRLPSPGPTPTPTIPPPYPAPNLLTPKDGVVYGSSEGSIALQWASVATLRENEIYQITIEDRSSDNPKVVLDYVADTRYIVPTSLQPTDNSVHIFRWSVAVVRQTGSTDAGAPIYAPAGASSEQRAFGWGGMTPMVPTATP
jgi:LysM repeat protein